MLALLTTSLSVSTMTLFWTLLAVTLMKDRAVKGTRARYVAKTSQIILIALFIIANLFLTYALILSADDALGKGWQALLGGLLSFLYGRWLCRLLSDDDDDWFNGQWKKLKRWVKGIRMAGQFKPMPAYVR